MLTASVSEEQGEKAMAENETMFLELEAGEVMLIHNWLLHRSDKNHSAQSRRAFSVCYIDARTVASNDERFAEVFGEGRSSWRFNYPEALADAHPQAGTRFCAIWTPCLAAQ